MSQRNFGQHQGGDNGWNKVPDWGSPQPPNSFQQGGRDGFGSQGFGSQEFGSENTSSLEFEENQGFNPHPRQERGRNFGQPQEFEQQHPRFNDHQFQTQDQQEGWGNPQPQSFENQQYQQNSQGYPQPKFDSSHYDQYGQTENSVSAHPIKKKWSWWSISLTVVIVAVLIFGAMVYFASRAKQNPSSDLKNKVTQVEKDTKKSTSVSSGSDRIFPENSQKSAEKKEEKTSSSTSAEEKPKEKTENLGSSASQSIASTNQVLDGAKVSSEVLVAKGVIKELHLVGGSDLAASYEAQLSVGSASLKVPLNYDLASQLEIGDTVTVRYRKLADVDKVVIESITK